MKKFYLLLLCLAFSSVSQQSISQEPQCEINVQLIKTSEERCPAEVGMDIIFFNTTEYTRFLVILFNGDSQYGEPISGILEPNNNFATHLGFFPPGIYSADVLLFDASDTNYENPLCFGVTPLLEFTCPCVDSDGDTVCDADDSCPAENASGCDANGDGCLDDFDTDGDGTLDCLDNCPTDPNKIAPGVCGCGIADTDSDGDLTPDCNDACPTDPNKTATGDCGCGTADTDSDGDLTPDCNDACPADPNKTAPGDCGCGIPDTDSDGDLTPDCNDACPADPNKTAPGDCGCGIPDTDSDGDLTPDCYDACPDDINKTEPGNCGCGVVETGDLDGDGVPDCNDNCPNIPNPNQEDTSGNGIGDACENCPDSDGDGICNNDDVCEGSDDLADGDGDTIPDGCDNCPNLSNPNQEPDGDCDGIFPAEDCDDNDPAIGSDANDADCDGVPTSEDCNDSDPDITTSSLVDSDNDGTSDCDDECPNDRTKIVPGDCGCGNRETDRDNDGVSDCIDQELRSPCPLVDANGVSIDSDGDGVADCEDICPGFDDNVDTDGDKIPDGCDNSNICRGDRIAICHENNGRFTTLCVSQQQLERHRSHPNDDLTGPCNGATASSAVYEEDEIGTNMELGIYPNPTADQINVELTNVEFPSTIRVISLLGIQIYEGPVAPAQSQTIQLNENLPAGTYIIQLINEYESISKKVVVEN